MSRAATLYHLQLVDQKLDGQRRRLAQIKAQQVETAAVREARAMLASAETALTQAEKQQRQLEGELQVLAAKVGEVEQRLYGGRIGNPKELGDLQKDQASLARRRQALEDEVLNAMLAVEDAQAALAVRRTQTATAEAAWQAEQDVFRAEQAQLESQIAGTEEERAVTEGSVRPDDLALYQSLRRSKGGQPVGVLSEGTCSACGVAPSGTRVSQARGEDMLVRCGNCERILYVDLGRFVDDDDL
jgi:predicted  nucleic acid-binding Zn-ribbon protein